MTQKFSTYGYTFIGVGDAGKIFATCANCGEAIRYYAKLKNNTSGDIVHIGQTCFANATPAQKREFTVAQRRARIGKKTEKYLQNDPVGIRLQAYCANHERSADQNTANWMLFLKKDQLAGCGYFNQAEVQLVLSLLEKEGA